LSILINPKAKKLSIEKTPLSIQVLHSIRRGILEGSLASGERLGEEEISAELGVSRHAVRMALSTLEAEGLVEGDAYKGKRVAELRNEQLPYLVATRSLLEATAVELAIALIDDEARRRLRRYAQRLREPMDLEEHVSLDLEFHEFLWSLSGDLRLQKLLRQVVYPFFAIQYQTRGRVGDWLQQEERNEPQAHQLLVNAICSGDVVLARKLIRQHAEWANFDETALSTILREEGAPSAKE
jgi:DNA-binding GntR family transcriptional regulator